MVVGMFRMASAISASVALMPVFCDLMWAISSSVSGNSGVDLTDQATVVMENTAPIMKAMTVRCGMLLLLTASLSMPIKNKRVGVK